MNVTKPLRAVKRAMRMLASERSIRVLSIVALTLKLASDVHALVTEKDRRIGFRRRTPT